LTASGISNRIADRLLLLVRRAPIPAGAKTRQLFETFENAGGVLINPTDDDLRKFVALSTMRDETAAAGRQQEFDNWLRSKKPLLETSFFEQAGLSPAPVSPPPGSPGAPGGEPMSPPGKQGPAAAASEPRGEA
jgi:hypothetical protein